MKIYSISSLGGVTRFNRKRHHRGKEQFDYLKSATQYQNLKANSHNENTDAQQSIIQTEDDQGYQ